MPETPTDDLRGRLRHITELPFLQHQRGDKLDLTLIALGYKKATKLILHKNDPALEEKKAALIDAGFECAWSREEAVNPHNVDLCVADSVSTLEHIQNATDADEQGWGEFSGYPQTAIEAYKSGDTARIMPPEELPEDIRQQDWFELLHFRLSREHWREEIKTLQAWYKSLQEYAPEFLREYVTYYRKHKIWLQQELERQRGK